MKKNAFTLIELLAVIVILAIIALIAIPIVINIINDSKKSSDEESIKMYSKSIENAISNYFLKFPREKQVTFEQLKDENLINYSGDQVECEIIQIGDEGEIYLTNCKVNSKPVKYEYGNPIFTLETQNYTGYYADVDGDGEVDGVIYADLSSSKNNEWNGSKYSYISKTDLKEYKISKEKYDGNFGKKNIISLKNKSIGNDRFYVMALNDFTTQLYTAFYWYKTAARNMTDYNTTTSVDFGTGRNNTLNIISKWTEKAYGTQNIQDIWGNISAKVIDGWFVPSRGEWAAFANELKISSDTYNSIFSLNTNYWTSSQASTLGIYYIRYDYENMGTTNVSFNYYDSRLRLSKTF